MCSNTLFGNRIGLPSIWVLLDIVVLGGLFGIPGMLLGSRFSRFFTACCATCRRLLARRGMSDEQPHPPPDSDWPERGRSDQWRLTLVRCQAR
jgi:hypothetical protein